MNVLNTALFWLHFMALSLGGLASFGIPLLAARMPTADPAARPVLAQAIQRFSKLGAAAIGTLILTGAILVFSKYNGVSQLGGWFWLKMGLVVVLVGVIAYNRRLGARAMQGDAQAARQGAVMARVAIALLAAVVGAAVLAFG